MTLSSAMQRYLQAIYVLHTDGERVIAARLAELLGVSPPTVSQTLRRLEKDGLVIVAANREIHLTPEGSRIAEAVVRRHRLVERWLTDSLGLDWAAAHTEAERLEKAISPLVEERLNEFLNHPQTCPHGNPIPGNSSQPEPGGFALTAAAPGQKVRVERILEHVESLTELLRYLHAQGVLPGVVLERGPETPFAGTITVRHQGGRELHLAREAAAQVWVRPLQAQQSSQGEE